MDVLLIILIAVVLLVVVGGAFFLRGRGDDSAVATRPSPSSAPTEPATVDETVPVDVEPDVIEVEPEVITRPSFRERLARARESLAGTLGSILSRGVDDQTWEELEEALIRADVGLPATMAILDSVRAKAEADGQTDADEVLTLLKAELTERLGGFDRSLARADSDPSVWLFVGVNGVGKTTTIGKLAKQQIDDGATVVVAAGDTFRAAAAEQLEMWADRSGATIVRGAEGGDPSAVVFDAVEHAAARDAEIVMADTAGRLHTKSNLMDELGKVRRVAEKGAGTVSEVLLVLDATTGQNGLTQVQQFTDAVDVTGVVLTKLDGSAKGGIVIAVQQELGIPVKLVGLGEGLGDLVPFDEQEFVDALFAVDA